MAKKPTYEELEQRVKDLEEDGLKKNSAEKELREREDRFRLLLENMQDGIVVVNKKGDFLYANEAAARTLGYNKEEFLELNIIDIEAKESEDEFKEHYSDMLKGRRLSFKTLHRKKDGSLIDVDVSLSMFDFKGERVTYSSWRDISERKQAENELQKSEERFKLALEGGDLGFWDYYSDTGEAFFDEKWLDMLGYKKGDIEENMQTWSSLLHPDDRPGVMEKLQAHFDDQNVVYEVEMRLRTKSGDYRWILGKGEVLVRDEEGNPLRMCGTHLDITDRKRLEAQLQQAQKMESIGTLAGGIAHDFNNILMPIIIHTELVQQSIPEDSPFQMNLGEIYKGAIRARDLVGQILAFSRQREEKKVPLKISHIIKEVLKLLRASLPTTIEIRQNIETETSAVHADPTQIHQVIMNLCTNAYHAMREHGGILEVSLSEVAIDPEAAIELPDLKSGSYIKLTVSDTGHGMNRIIMDRIFDPYYTTKEKGEGTGMGLAVAHGIIKSHDGAITVDSEPGKGTAFDIFLPMVESKVGMETRVTKPVHKGSERVLFVDDDQYMVDALVPMMENLGYQVTVETDSIKALEIFKERVGIFDLIITDYTMPHMTGTELAGEILKIRSDIPIILCTGFSDQIDEEKALTMGIKAFVKKPVVMKEMAATIRKALGDHEIDD